MKEKTDKKSATSRRRFVAVSGAGTGAMFLAGLGAKRADAADLSAVEKTNLEVVEAYDKNMSDPHATLEEKFARMKETCVDNLLYGQNNGNRFHGLPEVQKYYEGIFKGPDGGAKGLRTLEYQYSEVIVHGPVVLEYGLHFITPPGGPRPPATNVHCVVYFLKDGKIIERYDNSVRNT